MMMSSSLHVLHVYLLMYTLNYVTYPLESTWTHVDLFYTIEHKPSGFQAYNIIGKHLCEAFSSGWKIEMLIDSMQPIVRKNIGLPLYGITHWDVKVKPLEVSGPQHYWTYAIDFFPIGRKHEHRHNLFLHPTDWNTIKHFCSCLSIQ